MIDHISDYLFTPTGEAYGNAIEDNVKGEVIITGNAIVDSVERNIEVSEKESDVLERLLLDAESYILFTPHREENVDDPSTLSNLIEVIERVVKEFETQVICPIHPRTEKRLRQFGLNDEIEEITGLSLIDPVGYLDFLCLISHARIVLTDSGGIQEEVCILDTPCVTLRENTERPETVTVEANVIAGVNPDDVLEHVIDMDRTASDWGNPFGDGHAAERIANTILG